MAKQPYIPLYIGDWEQDTNCLSPLAEFALLKLTFKLFKSENKGIFITNFRTLSVLFKSNIEETKEIFSELVDNNVLNFEYLDEGKIKVISRRMVREANISLIKAEAGTHGGRGNKAKQKQTKSKQKPKGWQNTDIDIEYIVKLLNEKSGKNFAANSRTTVAQIQARLRDGFSKSDFEKVIQQKVADWGDSEKMSKYLRPETLFGSKFESYLNEVPKEKVTVGSAMTDEEIEAYIRGDMR